MIVFRIQHNIKVKGPYHAGFDICKTLSDKHMGPQWPMICPFAVRKFKKKGFTVFGFCSVRQLKNWFSSDDLLDLYCNGFSIYVYKIDKKHVLKRNRQCCFHLTESKRIKRIDYDLLCRLV